MEFLLIHVLVVLLVEGTTAETSAFSYDPSAWNGPAHWGSLDLGDGILNACNGTNQSPVGWKVTPTPSCDYYGNLHLTDTDTSADACSDARAQFHVTDHNLQANWPNADNESDDNDDESDSACVVQIAGTPSVIPGWQLLQFHLHTAPEHVLYGPPTGSAELHLVHTGINTQGSILAVIAVRLRATSNADDHPILESWISQWHQQQQQAQASSGCQKSSSSNSKSNINNYNNLYDIIPNNTAFYQYKGSLTTPPCSEIVHWSVAEDMVVISHTQWQTLQSLLVNYRDTTTCQLATVTYTNMATKTEDTDKDNTSTNNRPLQGRNGRAIFKLCPTEMHSQQSSSSRVYQRASKALIILLCLGAVLAAMLAYQKHSRLRLRQPTSNRQREKDHLDPPCDSECPRERTELVNRSKQQQQQQQPPNYTIC